MHIHEIEEREYQEYARLGPRAHDRMEAQMGAGWNDNWQDEFILTSHDVWVDNPHYHGPVGQHHPECDYRDWEAWSEANPELAIQFENELRTYYEVESLYRLYCGELD